MCFPAVEVLKTTSVGERSTQLIHFVPHLTLALERKKKPL